MAEQRVDGRTVRYQHRRGELLAAVMAYVLEHGVTDLSFRPLAQAVGVSHVTLRHHFGSKEELVGEIFGAIRRQEAPPPGPVDGDGAEAFIRELWSRWLTPSGERTFRLLFQAVGQALMHPDRYPRLLSSVVTDWIDIIARLAVESGCPPEDAPRFATLLLAQVRGLQLDLLITGDHDRVDAALDTALDALRDRIDSWPRRAETTDPR
ncbi:TetR/AcrR family transcriptional regulator [Actinomadura gamaensis]|uniref:TetR/AcrR family transcriptional regulator n=1 Tax=Actinomadura gamaensis TaxID=1763541 RepID=A0ABV9TZH2_9ACTN